MIENYDLENATFKELYLKKHLKDLPPVHEINGLPIHFDPKWKNIAVTLSGGRSSTLLVYILCQLIEKTNSDCKIYIVHNVVNPEVRPWTEVVFLKVYNHLKGTYPNIIQDYETCFVPDKLHEVKLKKLGLRELRKEFNVDVNTCYDLITRKFLDYLKYKFSLEYVYHGVYEYHETKLKYNNDAIILADEIFPFMFISKEWIIAQYDNFKLDELKELTRSCDEDYMVLGTMWLKMNNVHPPECEDCFRCKENAWAEEHKKKYVLDGE